MAAGDASRARDYGAAWAALMQLAREGHSWSGHERNQCFLNLGGGRFARISAVSGLDARSDGRALAFVDWDRDGDVDIWFRDRTAPRLRLLLNQHVSARSAEDRSFVSLRLEGTKANRDAIGASAEVVLSEAAEPPRRFVRAVRAGDLYLSQSSKWLHFGLGSKAKIREVVVRWPGGASETFAGVEPGNRYRLREGTGAAELARTDSVRLPPSRPVGIPLARSGGASILLSRRIPFPLVNYRMPDGQPRALGESPRERLLLIWSSTCAHCVRELRSLAAQAARVRATGLDVLALSVDRSLESPGEDASARDERVIANVEFPFAWGRLDSDATERIATYQRALFDRTPTFAVPLAFLLDREGNAVALYRGNIGIERVLRDVERTRDATNEELHRLAPPFPGRWFTRAVGDAAMAEFMARHFERRSLEDALPYLHLAAERASEPRNLALRRELGEKHHLLARRAREAREPERAAFHFEAALGSSPPSAELLTEFGSLLGSYGNLDAAEKQFRAALELDPGFGPAAEALRLVNRLRNESAESE